MDEQAKQIESKIVENKIYYLIFWPQSNTYVITASELQTNNGKVALPDENIAQFHDEKEARDFFNNIKEK